MTPGSVEDGCKTEEGGSGNVCVPPTELWALRPASLTGPARFIIPDRRDWKIRLQPNQLVGEEA